MHVIILLLILLFICFLIAHWTISLPVLLFFIYLCSTFVRYTSIKNKFRFHALWWIFQLMVIGGILYREELVDFTGDLMDEYTQKYDPMASRGISVIEPVNPMHQALGDSLETMDGKHLFAGLEVGMSPFESVWHIHQMDGLNKFQIGEVDIIYTRRLYHHNRLYGISMYFDDSHRHAKTDSLVEFLKQKYGFPHRIEKDEFRYQVEWHFDYKHIVIESRGYGLKNGELYIYQPQILADKITEENRKEKERMKQLQKEKQEREEQQRREELEQMEKLDKLKEKNRMLQQSL